MTVETSCYVCGKQEPSIDGLCGECTMKEFFNPGAAFAATFGSLADDGDMWWEDEAATLPTEHTGFFINVDGVDAHVLGDPNMSEKTRWALGELVKAAVRWLDEDTSPVVSWWAD